MPKKRERVPAVPAVAAERRAVNAEAILSLVSRETQAQESEACVEQQANGNRYVEDVHLADDWDHRAALVRVRIGPVLIKGVAVWCHPRTGRLRVYFPRYNSGPQFYDEAIELPAELRIEVEAEAIAAYKAAKSLAKKAANKKERDL